MFSYYDETIKKNASVDVSEDKGIQQAGELFYLTNPAYGEADYRYFTISLKIALHNSGVSCSLQTVVFLFHSYVGHTVGGNGSRIF